MCLLRGVQRRAGLRSAIISCVSRTVLILGGRSSPADWVGDANHALFWVETERRRGEPQRRRPRWLWSLA
jgi:hypothetical protein